MADADPRVDPPAATHVPGLLAEGARRFNRGAFWDAHEAWEGAWHRLRADGRMEDAHYLQGLILMSAAFENLQRGKAAGCRTQLAKAITRLQAGPDSGRRLGLADDLGIIGVLSRIHRAAAEHDAFAFDDLPEAPPALVFHHATPTDD